MWNVRKIKRCNRKLGKWLKFIILIFHKFWVLWLSTWANGMTIGWRQWWLHSCYKNMTIGSEIQGNNEPFLMWQQWAIWRHCSCFQYVLVNSLKGINAYWNCCWRWGHRRGVLNGVTTASACDKRRWERPDYG